jgi:hypothetical protein
VAETVEVFMTQDIKTNWWTIIKYTFILCAYACVRTLGIELGQSIHELHGSYTFYIRYDSSSIRTTSCIAIAPRHKNFYCCHIPGTELSAVKKQRKIQV